MFDVARYLDRIDYHGPLEPTVETLHGLHLAHLLMVPFENLDIHVGRAIVIDQPALFRKIVEQRRGGFCYELNGLFGTLLRALGFQVTMLSARVAREDGGFGPEFDHLTLLVQHQERWLVDVGFGDSFREPLRLDMADDQIQADRSYRVVAGEPVWSMLRREEGEWRPQYIFTLAPREHADFAQMCGYHQTSPASSFTQRRICTRATPEGRVTLSDMRLIITRHGERTERILLDESEYQAALQEYFGVRL